MYVMHYTRASMRDGEAPRMINEYLDYYDVQLEHQLEHDSTLLVEALAPSRRPQPRTLCLACGLEGMHRIDDETIKRHFSWAVPNDPSSSD